MIDKKSVRKSWTRVRLGAKLKVLAALVAPEINLNQVRLALAECECVGAVLPEDIQERVKGLTSPKLTPAPKPAATSKPTIRVMKVAERPSFHNRIQI
jgi:hypothetical protein